MYNRRIIIIIIYTSHFVWKKRGHFRPFIAMGQSVIVGIIILSFNSHNEKRTYSNKQKSSNLITAVHIRDMIRIILFECLIIT